MYSSCKAPKIQTDYRLALSLMFQLHHQLYEENHLDALWQDVKQFSPINKYWVQGNNNRRNGYQQRPRRRLRHEKRKKEAMK